MWSSLVITDDLRRYQVTNCYMGRAGLANGGRASGQDDFSDSITMAVRKKQTGGHGFGQNVIPSELGE